MKHLLSIKFLDILRRYLVIDFQIFFCLFEIYKIKVDDDSIMISYTFYEGEKRTRHLKVIKM